LEWTQLFFAVLLSIGTVISLGIAGFAWRRRSIPGAEYFAFYALAVALWCFGATIMLVSANPELNDLISGQAGSITIVAMPVAWLAFTLRYTGWVKVVTLKAWALMTALPLTVLLISIGLDIYESVQIPAGLRTVDSLSFIHAAIPFMNLAVIINIVLEVLFGIFLIIQRLIDSPKAFRGQYLSLLAGIVIPWSFGIPAMFIPQISDQIISLATVAGLLVIVWGIFRHQIFDILPIALDTVIQSMGDGVIVLDSQQRIVQVNPAALAILQPGPEQESKIPKLLNGLPIHQALAGWPQLLDYLEREQLESLIGLDDSSSREISILPLPGAAAEGGQKHTHYEVRISPLHDRWQSLSGWLILLIDITDRKHAQELLSQRSAETAVNRERNRLARDLHDSVTQSLYSLTLHAEAAARNIESGQSDIAAEYLQELKGAAKEAHGEMRQLIFALRPPILEKEGLLAAIQERVEAVEKQAQLKINISTNLVDRLPLNFEEELYRIAQEGLNNCLKHAQAQEIILSLHRHKNSVLLEIVDDGVGFRLDTLQDQRGLGLQGIKERVEKMGGKLTLWSEPGAGTTVKVEVYP
jgi:signal transduction histidine kinase